MTMKFVQIILRQLAFHNLMRGLLIVYFFDAFGRVEYSIFAKMTKYFAQNKICEVVYSIYSQSIIKVQKKEMFKVRSL